MDFLKILRSFEEFIFEAATWLAFYPMTMWRIIRRPLATMEYSDREQGQSIEARYDDALSPPLLLLITVVIVNLIAVAVHVPPPDTAPRFVKFIYASPQNLVMFRSVMFSLVPLIAALTLLRRQKRKVSRESLRPPFYAQCYLAAPSAAFMGAGNILVQQPHLPSSAGHAIMAIGGAWFVAVQTRWFHHKLGTSWAASALTVAWCAIQAFAYFLLIATPIALA